MYFFVFCFHLLQLAYNGRLCGRSVTRLVPGKVLIQTHLPTSHTLAAILTEADDLVLILFIFYSAWTKQTNMSKKNQSRTIPHFLFILCMTYFENGNVNTRILDTCTSIF